MRKIKWVLATFLSVALITGCSQEEVKEAEELDTPIEEIQEEVEEGVVINPEFLESTEQIHHIHGLAFHPNREDQLFIATHHGVVLYDMNNKEAFYVGESRDDFMGFKRVGATSALMSSGHPGIGNELPDPLGFMWSDDLGQTWDFRSLLGEVDFHALASSYHNDQHLIGFALDYSRGGHDGLVLRSLDQGYTWDELKDTGLPLDHHGVLDLSFSPESEDVIYAATVNGLMKSVNGGESFEMIHDSIVTAIKVVNNDTVLFYDEDNKHLVLMEQNQKKAIAVEANQVPINYITLKDMNSIETIVFSTMDSSLYISTNSGENWEEIIRSGTID